MRFQFPGRFTGWRQGLQAPYTLQGVFSVERQLPRNLTVAASYINLRTLHVLRTRPLNAPLPGTFIPGVVDSGVRPLNCADFIPPDVNPATRCNIFEYDSSGRYNQNQFIVNFNSRFHRNATMNAYYVLAKANSDTDGVGSIPADPYNLSIDYGRASGDIRHRFVMTGNFRAPWGITFNPFVIIQSGRPFNITLGRDLNGDTFNQERPAFAPAGANCDDPNIRCTPFGNFKLNFLPGDVMIPRNFGQGPGSTTVNVRVSKTWSFGSEGGSANNNQQNRQDGQRDGQRATMMGGGMAGAEVRVDQAAVELRAVVLAVRAVVVQVAEDFGGGGAGNGRYNLTFSLNFQNILNHVNFANPVGNLGSRILWTIDCDFGLWWFWPGAAAYNRRIDAQIRFSF